MPNVSGIIETAMYVNDVVTSAAFYRRISDSTYSSSPIASSPSTSRAKTSSSCSPKARTKAPVATPGGVIPGHAGAGPTHFAFSITAGDIDPWRKRSAAQNIPIESEVEWDGGAQSIYFRDPDQNLIELITAGFWKF